MVQPLITALWGQRQLNLSKFIKASKFKASERYTVKVRICIYKDIFKYLRGRRERIVKPKSPYLQFINPARATGSPEHKMHCLHSPTPAYARAWVLSSSVHACYRGSPMSGTKRTTAIQPSPHSVLWASTHFLVLTPSMIGVSDGRWGGIPDRKELSWHFRQERTKHSHRIERRFSPESL